MPIHINVTQTDANAVCLDYGYLLIKVTSTSDLSDLIEIFSMLRGMSKLYKMSILFKSIIFVEN